MASILLPDPLTFKAHIDIECGIPARLEIYSQSFWILSPSQHELNVTAYTAAGKEFFNFSSVDI